MTSINGLKLSEMFFNNIVRSLLKEKVPNLDYAAALIGSGSEVLGFDDEISKDHHWGPRLQIFLHPEDYLKYKEELQKYFSEKLPYTFHGFSTNWTDPDPNDAGTQSLKNISEGLINHRIEIHTVTGYIKKKLNIDSFPLPPKKWLVMSEQRLLEVTSGKVFYDNIGELTKIREEITYYPPNVWKFKLLGLWEQISQEMAFVGRTGMKGDDLGSRIETMRLIRYIIKIAYVLNKQYIPYQKWFTIAFNRLPIAEELGLILEEIVIEDDWIKREELLCEAYLILLREQNKLNITPPIQLKPQSYFSRPQTVIKALKIVEELKKVIEEPLKSIKHPIGTINEFIDSVCILENVDYLYNLIRI